MRKLIIFVLMLLPLPLMAATHWVSPTGTAVWTSCVGATALSGTAACSLATANANAAAGDLVYFRSGTYTQGAFDIGINPVNSGSSAANMITFQEYPTDGSQTAIISGGTNGFWLSTGTTGNTYISIKNFEFIGMSRQWGTIDEGANHIEIANNLFAFVGSGSQGTPTLFGGPESDLKFPTHVWIHGNTFSVTGQAGGGAQGAGCTDGGGDDLDIGQSGGTFGNTTGDLSNNFTIENNVFIHNPHAAIDGYGQFTVIRNNVFHNEPWSAGCATTTNYNNTLYSNSAYNGKYGHRDTQYTEDFNRDQTFNLFEGNRYGYGSINQANDGSENFDLATDGSILRYSFFYASMGACLQYKYQRGNGVGAGGNGGTYNRTYNNTFYDCGVGWPPAVQAVNSGCNTSSCPFASVAIATYNGGTTGSGQGNVLKNNLIYEPDSLGLGVYAGDAIEHSPGGSTPPFSPANAWADFATATNNWCTSITTFNSSAFCSGHGDPLFNNPDITNPSSTTLPDLSLKAGSGAIDGGTWLTTATNSGTGSTTLTVADALYFQDGTWGSDLSRPAAGLGGTMQADWIAIGTVGNTVQISTVSYGTYNAPAGTITLASPTTWSTGAHIWLYKKSDGAIVLNGTAPDLGASETGGSAPAAATPTASPVAGSYSTPQWVTLSSTTLNATIYYTIDGTPPGVTSPIYTHRLYIQPSQTIKAIAAASGFTNSSVMSALFSILPVKPSFSLSTTTPSINPQPTAPLVRSCCTNSWSNLETARGTYNFTNQNSWTTQAAALGAQFLYTFSHVPSWANGGGGIAVPPTDISVSGTCQAPLAGVVTTDCQAKEFVTKYMQNDCGVSSQPANPLIGTCKTRYFEVWNEFNGDGYWTGTDAQLAILANDASTIVHTYCGDCVVTAGSVSAGGDGFHTNGQPGTWTTALEDFLASWGGLAGANLPDAVSYHAYPSRTTVAPVPFPTSLTSNSAALCTASNTPNVSCRTAIKDMTGVAQSATILQNAAISPWAANLPVFSTEGGWGLIKDLCNGATCTESDSGVQTLRNGYVSQYTLVMAAAGTPQTLWYEYQNDACWGIMAGPGDNSACNTNPVLPSGNLPWQQAYVQTLAWLNAASAIGAPTSIPVSSGNVWTVSLNVGGVTQNVQWYDGWLTTITQSTSFNTQQNLQGLRTSTGGNVTLSQQPTLLYNVAPGAAAPPGISVIVIQ